MNLIIGKSQDILFFFRFSAQINPKILEKLWRASLDRQAPTSMTGILHVDQFILLKIIHRQEYAGRCAHNISQRVFRIQCKVINRNTG